MTDKKTLFDTINEHIGALTPEDMANMSKTELFLSAMTLNTAAIGDMLAEQSDYYAKINGLVDTFIKAGVMSNLAAGLKSSIEQTLADVGVMFQQSQDPAKPEGDKGDN
jgi:hypothetical protein